ncbi:unnamed protein product, partial [Urochloa humidicola]
MDRTEPFPSVCCSAPTPSVLCCPRRRRPAAVASGGEGPSIRAAAAGPRSSPTRPRRRRDPPLPRSSVTTNRQGAAPRRRRPAFAASGGEAPSVSPRRRQRGRSLHSRGRRRPALVADPRPAPARSSIAVEVHHHESSRFPSMEAEGFDSLEQLNEYKSVASQTFLREEDFYDFYNQYALEKGFGIRKDDVTYKRGTKEVIWRRFVCNSEGYRLRKFFERTDKKRKPRALTRCGCTARLDVEWSESLGIWYVKDFVDVHSHA